MDVCFAKQPCPALATFIQLKGNLKRNKESLYSEAN